MTESEGQRRDDALARPQGPSPVRDGRPRKDSYGKRLERIRRDDGPVDDRPISRALPRKSVAGVGHFGVLNKAGLAFIALVLLIKAGSGYMPAVRQWLTVRSLAAALNGPDEQAWEGAASSLATWGDAGAPYLLAAARSARPGVRDAALGALARGAVTADVLSAEALRALNDPDSLVRERAVGILGALLVGLPPGDPKGLFGPGLRGLRRALKDTDTTARAGSARAIGALGVRARPAVEDLTDAVADPEIAVRIAAARALMRVDSVDNPDAVRAITAAIDLGDPVAEGLDALDVLIELGPKAAVLSLPSLITMLGSGDDVAEQRAMEVIGKIGPAGAPALEALERLAAREAEKVNTRRGLQRNRAGVGRMAVSGMGGLGSPVRYHAATTALAIDPKPSPWVVDALVRLVLDQGVAIETREAAAKTLKANAPEALAKTVPELFDRVINETDPFFRGQEGRLLQEIDPRAGGADDPDPARDAVSPMEVTTARVKSILTRASGYLEGVCSHSLQPYRGCPLGASLCGVGCYVRHAGHMTLGRAWGSFLEVRENAAGSYREGVARERSWARRARGGFVIFLSSATEPFPPQEARFGVTRSVLAAMLESPPDGLIVQTHSAGVLGAVDLLVPLAGRCDLRVHLSIETDRDRLPGLPPSASPVARRFEAAKALRGAGLRVVITVAPLLPIDDPDGFFGRVAACADAVVIDHYLGGDGSPGDSGARTLRTPLPAAMAAVDPESTALAYRDRMAAVALRHLPGRVGVGRDGFAGRFLGGGAGETAP